MNPITRSFDLRDRDVWEKVEAWLAEPEEAMAEQLRVKADGEHILLVADGEDGKCEVRLSLAETERFEEALDKVRKRVSLKVEARRSREAMRVDKVHEDEEDFEESE
jgi:hypothetical protein